MLRKIKLYGNLAEFCGGQNEFEAVANTPAEAIRFLAVNFKGLDKHMSEQFYQVKLANTPLDYEEILYPAGYDEIKIIPVVHGEIFFLAAGALAIGAAQIGAIAGISIIGSLTVGSLLTTIGTTLIIQGVSDLLFPPPTPPTFGGDEQDPSFTFDGTTNIAKQGVPINIVYGETLIGTNTISANIDTLQVVNN